MECSEFKEWLDAYIDGEADEDLRARLEAHARDCLECARELEAAEQLREVLSHMDEKVAVPLPAQAAWRSAVRQEAKRRRMKRIYSAVGAAAAACVVLVGVTMLLKSDGPVGSDDQGAVGSDALRRVAYVQSDGVSEDAVLEASVSPAVGRMAPMSFDYPKCYVCVDDIETAQRYLMDIVEEYGAVVECETGTDNGHEVSVVVPGESAAEFIRAVENIGSETAENAYVPDDTQETVGICIVLTCT